MFIAKGPVIVDFENKQQNQVVTMSQAMINLDNLSTFFFVSLFEDAIVDPNSFLKLRSDMNNLFNCESFYSCIFNTFLCWRSTF